MEDSEKESQGVFDDVKESKDGDINANMEPEPQKAPSLANADNQMSTEVQAKNEIYGETALEGDKQSNDGAEAKEQSNSKIEVHELSSTRGMADDSCIAKIEVEAQSKDSSEAQDQSNSSVKNEMKETVDSQNAAEEQEDPSKDGKTSGDPVESKVEAKKAIEEEKSTVQNGQLPFQLPVSAIPPKKKEVVDEDHQNNKEGTLKVMVDQVHNRDTEAKTNELKKPENISILPAAALTDETSSKVTKHEPRDTSVGNNCQSATPELPVRYATRSAGHSGQTLKNAFDVAKMPESDEGTPEEQAAFMKDLDSFYRERSVEFKPPKFYGQQLNCLKLWRSVIRLGGYDRITGAKLWRQVGESFHPPKTCTTVSWTFRIFYEKSLLDYERYQRQCGELELPVVALAEPSSVEEGNGYQASGSGRARRDAAARAMQGWHVQKLFGLGEAGEPIIKDKNVNNMPKRENKLKSIGSLKQKRPNEIELPVKAQRTETSKQLVTNVVDIGPPADWVKINVREIKDSFEVYALVPGLLREEVRVQSDPAGRLVITGQPEQPDNPWGITPFKKVVSLPARIDPLQTSAVVSLHGRLFVRAPFEQSNI